MADLIDRVLLLGRVDAFAQLGTEQLSLLALAARPEVRSAGSWIYHEGANATAMYLVVSGRIALQRGGLAIAEVGPGEDFGTWALFDPEPRLTAARAASDVTLLTIDRQAFEQLVEENPDLAHGIFRSLARRVRSLAQIVEESNEHRPGRENWT